MVAGHLARGSRALAQRKGELRRVDRGHDVIVHERLHAVHGWLGEHEDGPLDARLAQLHALVYGGNGKLVGTGRVHGSHATLGAVPIRVRLHNAHHLDAGFEERLELARVLLEGREVNLNPRPPARRALNCHAYAP